jgi:hypothetical protein
MTVSVSNPSPQLSAVLQFYDAITNWKFDTIEELFDDDYRHTTLPSTAKEPEKNKAQGLAHAKGVGAALRYTPLKVRCWISSHAPWGDLMLFYATVRDPSIE